MRHIRTVQTPSKYPIHFAIKNLELVKYMIEKGSKLDSPDKDSLDVATTAVLNDSYDVADYLHGNITKDELWIELHNLIANMQEDKNLKVSLFEYYVKRKIDLNRVNVEGNTLLHLLLYKNSCRLPIIKYIVISGCDIFIENDKGLNVIELSKKHESDIIYKYLTSLGG